MASTGSRDSTSMARGMRVCDHIEVPSVIFDARRVTSPRDVRDDQFHSDQINRSHLVDLLDRISRTDDETRLAASLVKKALRGGFITASVQDQSPGRPQPPGEMDSAGGSLHEELVILKMSFLIVNSSACRIHFSWRLRPPRRLILY